MMFNSQKVVDKILGKEKKLKQDKPVKLWGENKEVVFTPQKSESEILSMNVLSKDASTCPWCKSIKTRTKTFVNDDIGLVCDNCGKSYGYNKVTGEIDKTDWRI